MMYVNYLRAHRKRWFLSQEELVHLVGHISTATLSRYEYGQQSPRADVLLGCEIVFGVPAKDLFPGLYQDLEDAIMRRAAKLDAALADQVDTPSIIKRALLREMTERASVQTPEA
jgi:transcriptional regulator with XRE-family HTH domain